MGMKQIQLQILAEAMDKLKAAAKKKGITPNILVRLILHEYFGQPTDTDAKTYTLTVKNWNELEAYVEAKRLGSVEVFAAFAMQQYQAKYPLKECKERQNGKSIGIADTPR
jgi:hypothetical protein